MGRNNRRIWSTLFKRWWIGLIGAIAVLFFMLPVEAINFQQGETVTIGPGEVIEQDLFAAGDQITIGGTVEGSAFLTAEDILIEGTITDDLYATAATITIDGSVAGDLFVAGRTITLNGDIDGDVTAAAQSIALNGSVGDDIRMAGESLLLAVSQVEDDVIAAGFSLEQKPGTVVGGNLIFAGAQALLAGTVEQNLVGAIGSLNLTGTINDDATLTVGSDEPFRPPFTPEPAIAVPDVPPGFTVADSAQVGGTLSYRSDAEADIAPGASLGNLEADIRPLEPATETVPPGVVIWQRLQRLIALTIVAWLLLKYLPDWLQTLAAQIRQSPLKSLGWGAAMLIGVSVASALLIFLFGIFTVFSAIALPSLTLPIIGIGTIANLALPLALFLVVAFLGPIVLSIIGGDWIAQRASISDAAPLLPVILALVVIVLLTSIPLLNLILTLLMALWGLGSLWLWSRAKRRSA